MESKNFKPKPRNSTLEISANNLNLDNIKNWEEKENGEVYIKKTEAKPTPLWDDGWYKNPSSGRSVNYGVNTKNPKEHSTIIIKGGSFFNNEKCQEFLLKNSGVSDELYGSISFVTAQKEHDIALLIQDKFKSLLNKKANCPEPVDINQITGTLNEGGDIIELSDFFTQNSKGDSGISKFIKFNFLKSASKIGIDVSYPMNEEAGKEIKDDPFRWVISQYLEKEKQGIYRYKIDGPNTRLLDLMTLKLSDRQKYFTEANNAIDVSDAVEKFASKLGEFYAVLQKNGIGYHSGSSEHCTLIDITISGVIMDIGGLSEYGSTNNELKNSIVEFLKLIDADGKITNIDESIQNNSISKLSEAYIAQLFQTINLIVYLCENILKTDKNVSEDALNIFWERYKSIYSDENIKSISEQKNTIDAPEEIRTNYLDSTTGDLIELASDLKDLYQEQ